MKATRHLRRPLWALLVLPGVLAAQARGAAPPDTPAAGAVADPCAAFARDVRHERALFAEAPQQLSAGKAFPAAPAVSPDRLYRLQLLPQSQVSLAAPSGSHHPPSGETYAGLATLKLAQAGTWRVSLDQATWVDVVAKGAVIGSQDHQGRSGCNAPHKVVEFVLPAGTALTLQFSNSKTPALLLSVTRSPVH